eukprot:3585716-Pyramimonas_sp.AAC.1
MAFRAMKADRPTRRILHTAILPRRKWGGEVSGFTVQELDDMRRIAKQIYGHSHMSPDIFGA